MKNYNKETTKISALSSGNIDQYEYLKLLISWEHRQKIIE